MKKIYYLVVAAFFCLFIPACHYDGDTIVNEKPTPTFGVVIEELTAKDVCFYEDANDVTTLGFRKDKADIPYIRFDAKTVEIMKGFLSQTYEFSAVAADTKTVTIKNTNRNTAAVVDLTKHSITFENYDLFFQKTDDGPYMDPTGCSGCDYLRITDSSNIAGQSITLSWATQDIGVVIWKESDSYNLALPLQTFNDVFLSPCGNHIIYNGNYLYIASNDYLVASEGTDKGYWKTGNQSGTRSEALAEFCYNELCLNFDLNYGLKAIHGIEKFADFDAYFKKTGTRDSLKSTDAATFAKALKDVCVFYFGDGHSGYNANSHYLDKNLSIPLTHTPSASVAWNLANDTYTKARGTPGTISGYIEQGDTAIVRFDHFKIKHGSREKVIAAAAGLSSKIDSYVNKYEDEYDTIALINYANSQIQKANSSIKNVVLDLSLNGGGANHAAAVVIAWMLGKCDFYFTNPITGAKWSITYSADVNMNGTYDEAGDTIKDKNLFCLIAPCSFSCGNLVPAMLKASNNVTILGVSSSGGSSCVQNSSAADGTVIQMSSKNVMSISKNGSNYDIDKGVEPHYFINKPENFYTPTTIKELVNNINSGKLAVSTSNN